MKDKIQYLLHDTSRLSEVSLQEIRQMLENYPFYQPLHFLLQQKEEMLKKAGDLNVFKNAVHFHNDIDFIALENDLIIPQKDNTAHIVSHNLASDEDEHFVEHEVSEFIPAENDIYTSGTELQSLLDEEYTLDYSNLGLAGAAGAIALNFAPKTKAPEVVREIIGTQRPTPELNISDLGLDGAAGAIALDFTPIKEVEANNEIQKNVVLPTPDINVAELGLAGAAGAIALDFTPIKVVEANTNTVKPQINVSELGLAGAAGAIALDFATNIPSTETNTTETIVENITLIPGVDVNNLGLSGAGSLVESNFIREYEIEEELYNIEVEEASSEASSITNRSFDDIETFTEEREELVADYTDELIINANQDITEDEKIIVSPVETITNRSFDDIETFTEEREELVADYTDELIIDAHKDVSEQEIPVIKPTETISNRSFDDIESFTEEREELVADYTDELVFNTVESEEIANDDSANAETNDDDSANAEELLLAAGLASVSNTLISEDKKENISAFHVYPTKKILDLDEIDSNDIETDDVEDDIDEYIGKIDKEDQPQEEEATLKKKKKKKKKKDKSSFNSWLSLSKQLKKADKDLEKEKLKKKKKKKKKKLKEKEIIKEANKSNYRDQSIVSETLATILGNQGHFKDSISMYNQLSLLYPEKSSYFAEKIEELNKLKDND